MSIYITVDIGGTQIRAAAFPILGYEPLKIKRIATQNSNRSPAERLITLIEDVIPVGEDITAIGVAAPGPLDPSTGVIFETPNIPELHHFPLASYLADHFKKPVALDNDANLAALGEWTIGAGKGHKHLIYLTISTGIGSGIIIDGHLLHGEKGLAPELGHTIVLPNGPRCSCGHRGHLEAVASGPAITRWVQQAIEQGKKSLLSNAQHLTAKTIADAATQGDQLAKAAFERAGTFIGQALADFVHIFNPSVIILGGGVSRSGDLLLPPINTTLRELVIDPNFTNNLTITTAKLGDNAGLIGAKILAQTIKS
ncbi:MAG: ROK family protein [Chloroflexota bacterium]